MDIEADKNLILKIVFIIILKQSRKWNGYDSKKSK